MSDPSQNEKIRRGYADTPAGQIHYRTMGGGERAKPLLLLHWVPMSGRLYEHVLPLFAARGYEAYAPDTMGFGMSDARSGEWQISDYAANMIDFLDALGIPKTYMVAGHMGAAVGCEMAIHYPKRISRMVLDGSPCWDQETRDKMKANVSRALPEVAEDGAHKTLLWDKAFGALGMINPVFKLTDESLGEVYALGVEILQTRFEPSALAVFNYDMRMMLTNINHPTLALTSDKEILRDEHDIVPELMRDCEEHIFPGVHPLLVKERAEEFVDVVDRFLSA